MVPIICLILIFVAWAVLKGEWDYYWMIYWDEVEEQSYDIYGVLPMPEWKKEDGCWWEDIPY